MTPQLPPQYATQPKASGKGCLFWGGIIAGILFLCFLLTIVAAYFCVKHLVYEYTDTKPIEMAVAPLSDADAKALQQRLDDFDHALTNGTPVEPLVLTADEINSLIAKQTKSSNKVRLCFSFNENRVQAQLSLSGDLFGFRMLRGRYLNGSGDFKVSLHDGRLFLGIESLSVKGKPVPDQYLQGVRGQNFADAFMQGQTNNPALNKALNQLQEIKIEDGKLFVIPKIQKPETTPQLEAGK